MKTFVSAYLTLGIRIMKGKEMALVWHEKASNCFADGFLITNPHSSGTDTHMTTVNESAEQCLQL